MSTEYSKEEKKEPRKNNHNRFKAFLIGVAALAGIGGTTAVKVEHDKEKAVKEWKKIASDADSVSVDVKQGHFYAVKKLDKEALENAEARRAILVAREGELVDKANKDFKKAFQNLDVEAMEKAIKAGANNMDEANSEGQTPLMQVLEKSESAKAYRAARLLIKYSDLSIEDKNGATAFDYASAIRTAKGEVLKREITERGDYRKYGEGTYWKSDEEKEISEIDNILLIRSLISDVDKEIEGIKKTAYKISADKKQGISVENGQSHYNEFYSKNLHAVAGIGTGEPQKTASVRNFFEKHVR